MKIKGVKKLDFKEDVYCMKVEHTHCFALANGVIAHNCCGHDFQKILNEGFNGVTGRPNSQAPKHFREALYQLANYFGILQAEWAGAQAVSSFDTYLSPYVFFDNQVNNLDDDAIKKAMRNFVYNLNVPSRWGQCVPDSYKCLKGDGTWVNYKDLKEGDEIYVVGIGSGQVKKDKVLHINVFDSPDKMHRYYDGNGFEFYVTSQHRVMHYEGVWVLTESAKLFGKTAIIPVLSLSDKEFNIRLEEYGLDDNALGLASHIRCKNEEVDCVCEKVWCPTTNTGTFICMNDDGQIFFTGNSPFTNVTIDWTVPHLMEDSAPLRHDKNYFSSIIDEWKEKYGEDETKRKKIATLEQAIRRRFAEIDPEMYDAIKDDFEAVVLSFTYRFFQKEMNMINKAFYEVLNEGDTIGQPFTFPIPTINITEDFDWDGENTDLLFENTAKYGSSYFQNFVGSQYMIDENGNKVRDPNAYSPNDIRSMCPLSLDTLVPTNNGIKPIIKLDPYKDRVYLHGVWYPFRRITNIPQQDCYEVLLEGYMPNGDQVSFKAGGDHLQPVYNKSSYNLVKKQVRQLTQNDYIPIEVIYDTINQIEISPQGQRFVMTEDRIQCIQVQSIRRIPSLPLMCIEVDNPEHNFTLANGIITSNCRLQLDKRQLRLKGGGLFGSDAQTGSVSVVTINCPRLGYTCKGDKKKLYAKLDRLLDMAKSTHEKKRAFVTEMLARGLYPYTRRYIGKFDTYFSTIGVNGVNEMIRNFTNDAYDITTPEGQAFAKEFLVHIREKLIQYQEETGNLYNLEATPAEGTMRRFAHLDKEKYPDILQAGFSDSIPYYTNSSQLPVEFTADAFTALDLQDDLQKLYTGGTTLHLYTRERISTAEACKRLVRAVLHNYRLPYISVTPTFSTCPKHGRIEGEYEYCPKCDQELLNKYAKEVDDL